MVNINKLKLKYKLTGVLDNCDVCKDRNSCAYYINLEDKAILIGNTWEYIKVDGKTERRLKLNYYCCDKYRKDSEINQMIRDFNWKD